MQNIEYMELIQKYDDNIHIVIHTRSYFPRKEDRLFLISMNSLFNHHFIINIIIKLYSIILYVFIMIIIDSSAFAFRGNESRRKEKF